MTAEPRTASTALAIKIVSLRLRFIADPYLKQDFHFGSRIGRSISHVQFLNLRSAVFSPGENSAQTFQFAEALGRQSGFSTIVLQTANGGVVSGFSHLEIMWASVRPILREMQERGMDPQSTVFPAQPCRR